MEEKVPEQKRAKSRKICQVCYFLTKNHLGISRLDLSLKK